MNIFQKILIWGSYGFGTWGCMRYDQDSNMFMLSLLILYALSFIGIVFMTTNEKDVEDATCETEKSE